MFAKGVSVFLLPLAMAQGLASPVGAEELTPARCKAVVQLAQDYFSKGEARFQAQYAGLEDGACTYSEIVIAGSGRYTPTLHIGTLSLAGNALNWKPDGSVKSADLTLTAEGIRTVAKSGDERTDYLFDAQSRLGEMAFELRANWDGAGKELRIGQFDLQIGEASQISFDGLLKNVDLATAGAAQMALTGFTVNELNLEIKSFGLFEQFVLPAVISSMPDSGAASEDDFAALVASRKLELRSAINQLPDAAFPAPSRAALAALLSDLPNPRGKLVIGFRSASGFGPARLARFALTGMPSSVKELAPLFDDTRFDIDWRRGDRS